MSYIQPGVYIQQKYLASGAGLGGFIVPVVIGQGLKRKRIWSEAIVRGIVIEELTIDPDTLEATLSYTSDRGLQWSRLYRDGVDLGNGSFTYVNATTIKVKTAYWVPGSHVYKFQYLALNKMTDNLQYDLEELLFVAASPEGTRVYSAGVDFQVTGNAIDWSVVEPVELEGLGSAPFDLSERNRIRLSIDNRPQLEIIITGETQTEVTAQEVADAINAALEASSSYGSLYANVASVDDDDHVILTAVKKGEQGSIGIYAASEADASSIIFGVTTPFFKPGVGSMPAIGTTYYVRYDTERPAEEYNSLRLFYSYADAMDEIGPMNVQNDLLIAIQLLFENGASIVGIVQVADGDGDGVYTSVDWMNAIDVLKQTHVPTDVILLSVDVDVMAYLVRVIEEEASLLKDHWMGAWFGVPYGTRDGDMDTPGTAIYIATTVLQVPADSQGRGRYILVTTPVVGGVKKTIIDTDTKLSIELDLDTSFLAAAVAGLQASQSPVSDSLLRKQVVGFSSAGVSNNEVSASWLAGNGVFVVMNKGGRLVCFDPVTTDIGGDEGFSEPSVRVQKDYLANRIRTRLDQYVIGVTPDRLDEFVYELKYHIALEIERAILDRIIAPYTDDSGAVRSLDMATDIVVYRDPVSKSTYRFTYWFNARYAVKRIFGEYVVDVKIS